MGLDVEYYAKEAERRAVEKARKMLEPMEKRIAELEARLLSPAQPQTSPDGDDISKTLFCALQGLMVAYGAVDGRNGNSGECWDKAREAVALYSSLSRPHGGRE